MQVAITTLDQGEAGTIELSPAIFEQPLRPDILHQVVRWQLAKRRQGTHKTQDPRRDQGHDPQDVQAEGHRPGAPRRGDRAPVPRRRQAVRPQAARPRPQPAQEGAPAGPEGRALEQARRRQAGGAGSGEPRSSPRPSRWRRRSTKLGWSSALLIDGDEIDRNFALASRNLAGLQLLPSVGANVYDILRRDVLVLTTAAVRRLEERLA